MAHIKYSISIPNFLDGDPAPFSKKFLTFIYNFMRNSIKYQNFSIVQRQTYPREANWISTKCNVALIPIALRSSVSFTYAHEITDAIFVI